MSIPLAVTNLRKVYPPEKKGGAAFVAVDDISFELQQGEILGLLGPNGAGKSTTISMLLGVLTPTAGSIYYNQREFSQHRSEILATVTFASTYIRMPWRLTVMENLRVYGLLYGLSNAEFTHRAKKFLQFFGVWNQREKNMSQLSAGQVTRVMLAKAFIPYPAVVLLDEPTASLDPDIAHEVRQFIRKQQQEFETSILYTSHNMDEVADICDRVVFLQQGKVIAVDTPKNLASSVSVARITLTMQDGLKRAERFATEKKLESTVVGRSISIAIDESQVAAFLNQLAQEKITYTQIAITQPTLEDYFLSKAARRSHD